MVFILKVGFFNFKSYNFIFVIAFNWVFQAIECVLTRLDNFGSFDGLKELLDEMILNKTFFLLPDSLEEGYARVSLYEKGKESDRINVNELIIQRLLEKSIAKLPSIEVMSSLYYKLLYC